MKLFLIFFIYYPLISLAEEINTQPLFETGFFLGSLSIADYPASDQYRVRTIPLPLIHYHGDLFRADKEDGTRFRFINNEKFDFDLSFGGSFPTETDSNQARVGMPVLDWTGEIGPRLLYYILKDKNNAQIRIGFPIRTTFATNFTKWYGVGYVLAPTFQIDKYNFLTHNLNLYFIYTYLYLDRRQAEYFYQIDSQYETIERKTYTAHAGTLGSEYSLAFNYTYKNKTFVLATQYADYTESANTNSYLHRSNINWTYFIGISWILSESEERVPKL